MDNRLALTLDTPRASTQPNPWGTPDGPGLWHHKGLMLPAYIQNVSKALARGGLGESQAIHKAVGIVEDWKDGRTPNGKGHVHPDVQAAAAKAWAEWEAKRAEAHTSSAPHGKVAATMSSSLSKVLQLSTGQGEAAYPDADDDPRSLAAAVDACLDQACDLLHGVSLTSLPPEVQQAIALVYAASSTVDELLQAMGVPDPDEGSAPAAMSAPASSRSLGRLLALSGNSSTDSSSDSDGDADGDDLDGGSLTSAGAVMMPGQGRVGMVKAAAGGKHIGVHRSGAKTAPMATRKAAGNAVISMHKKQGK
jgi:hypothetical protein